MLTVARLIAALLFAFVWWLLLRASDRRGWEKQTVTP